MADLDPNVVSVMNKYQSRAEVGFVKYGLGNCSGPFFIWLRALAGLSK